MAVSVDTKTFYVADGYCNSRIIRYSITVTSDGKHAVNKITEWGKTAGVMSIKRVSSFGMLDNGIKSVKKLYHIHYTIYVHRCKHNTYSNNFVKNCQFCEFQ